MVVFTKKFSDGKQTEDIVEDLTDLILREGNHISTDQVKRLNDIFKIERDNLGARGYATNLLWSCVAKASSERLLFY